MAKLDIDDRVIIKVGTHKGKVARVYGIPANGSDGYDVELENRFTGSYSRSELRRPNNQDAITFTLIPEAEEKLIVTSVETDPELAEWEKELTTIPAKEEEVVTEEVVPNGTVIRIESGTYEHPYNDETLFIGVRAVIVDSFMSDLFAQRIYRIRIPSMQDYETLTTRELFSIPEYPFWDKGLHRKYTRNGKPHTHGTRRFGKCMWNQLHTLESNVPPCAYGADCTIQFRRKSDGELMILSLCGGHAFKMVTLFNEVGLKYDFKRATYRVSLEKAYVPTNDILFNQDVTILDNEFVCPELVGRNARVVSWSLMRSYYGNGASDFKMEWCYTVHIITNGKLTKIRLIRDEFTPIKPFAILSEPVTG